MKEKRNGVVRMIRNRLKKSGLSGKVLEMALAATISVKKEIKRLPRDVSLKAAKMIQKTGSALIVQGNGGNMRVYSLEGHRNSVATAKKHKPWTKRSKE